MRGGGTIKKERQIFKVQKKGGLTWGLEGAKEGENGGRSKGGDSGKKLVGKNLFTCRIKFQRRREGNRSKLKGKKPE